MSRKDGGADHAAGPCQQKEASGYKRTQFEGTSQPGWGRRVSPEVLKHPDHIKGILSEERSHIEMLRQFQNEIRAMQEDVLSENTCLSAQPKSTITSTSNLFEDDGSSVQKITEESKVIRAKLQTSENKLQDAEKSVRELQDKVKLLERAKTQCAKEAESRVGFLKKQIDDFVSSAESMRQEAEDKTGELEKQILMLEAEKNNAEARALNMQHAVPEEEYYALQRQVNEAEVERREAAMKQESAEEHVQSLSHERALLQKHCAQVVDFAKHMEIEKDMEQARTVAYFEDQLANAKVEMAQLHQNLDEAIKKLHLAEARLEREAADAAHRKEVNDNTIAELHALLMAHHSATNELRNESEKGKRLEMLIGELLQQASVEQKHTEFQKREGLSTGRNAASSSRETYKQPHAATPPKATGTVVFNPELTATVKVDFERQHSAPSSLAAPRGRKYFVPQTPSNFSVPRLPGSFRT